MLRFLKRLLADAGLLVAIAIGGLVVLILIMMMLGGISGDWRYTG